MAAVTKWTGRIACALQEALRLTNEEFAEHLGVGLRTVSSWHQEPDKEPRNVNQQVLDTALERVADDTRERFNNLTGATQPSQQPANPRLINDSDLVAVLDWLDQYAGWSIGTARAAVDERLAVLNEVALQDRARRRGSVDQRAIAEALAEYYGSHGTGHGRYAVTCAGTRVATSVLTRVGWLDLACPLAPGNDRLNLAGDQTRPSGLLDPTIAARAVERIAETVLTGTRMVNMPLYLLGDIGVRPGMIDGSVNVAPFVEYALTMDLLEGELADALAAGHSARQGTLPVRDTYLPTIDTVLSVDRRICAGGTLALCAIARPAEFGREPDYLLLVQERSGSVLNAARTLAVIPKAFHQPLTDVRVDAQVGRTVRREMEEELFGRKEVDNTLAAQRTADPLHTTRLSKPMRWLTEQPDRLTMECTGFGLNLVSGNYEFASLIVIEDEEFWRQFGGTVEANWETSSLRQYSSVDDTLLGELVTDVAWSNEGLFAFAQGLRRLAEIDGDRVKLPDITQEVLA